MIQEKVCAKRTKQNPDSAASIHAHGEWGVGGLPPPRRPSSTQAHIPRPPLLGLIRWLGFHLASSSQPPFLLLTLEHSANFLGSATAWFSSWDSFKCQALGHASDTGQRACNVWVGTPGFRVTCNCVPFGADRVPGLSQVGNRCMEWARAGVNECFAPAISVFRRRFF